METTGSSGSRYPSLMARFVHIACFALTVIELSGGVELAMLADNAARLNVYSVHPRRSATGRQRQRELMLRLKRPPASSPFEAAPSDRMNPADWLDSLLQGIYHPLDDKGGVLEDVPETRFGIPVAANERQRSGVVPNSRKRLNVKKNELDRQSVFIPADMGQLLLEQPVRLEKPLPVPVAFRNEENLRNKPTQLRSQRQPSYVKDLNHPSNQRPNYQQKDYSKNSYNNQQFTYDYQRPEQPSYNSQELDFQIEIVNGQQQNYPQQNYNQNGNEQDDYQQQNYNHQQSDYQPQNYDQTFEQVNYPDPSNRPGQPYSQTSNGSYDQHTKSPGRSYVLNVDVYVQHHPINRRNQSVRSNRKGLRSKIRS